jgi:hypothetical protein
MKLFKNMFRVSARRLSLKKSYPMKFAVATQIPKTNQNENLPKKKNVYYLKSVKESKDCIGAT